MFSALIKHHEDIHMTFIHSSIDSGLLWIFIVVAIVFGILWYKTGFKDVFKYGVPTLFLLWLFIAYCYCNQLYTIHGSDNAVFKTLTEIWQRIVVLPFEITVFPTIIISLFLYKIVLLLKEISAKLDDRNKE